MDGHDNGHGKVIAAIVVVKLQQTSSEERSPGDADSMPLASRSSSSDMVRRGQGIMPRTSEARPPQAFHCAAAWNELMTLSNASRRFHTLPTNSFPSGAEVRSKASRAEANERHHIGITFAHWPWIFKGETSAANDSLGE